MNTKICAILPLAILLLACKPVAQATTQSDSPQAASDNSAVADASSKNVLAEEDEQWRKRMPKGITESFYGCIKRGNHNDFEEANCASDEKRLQDERLNKVYKELLATSNAEQRKSLIEAQRSWLVWTNNEELFEQVAYGDEPMDNVELELREMERLARRADEFENYKANIELRKP